MSAIDVKLIAQCLASLRDLERATITDLAESTGLSRPTVTAALTAMTESGLAIEHEARAAAGRPARTFSPVAGSPVVVGIDLTRSAVRLIVADRTGRVLGRQESEVASPTTGQPSLAPVRTLLQQNDLGVLRRGRPLDESLRRRHPRVMAADLGEDGTVLRGGKAAHRIGAEE